MTEREQARLIYADYGLHSRKAALPRSGFYLVGIHDENGITVANRPDTVSEHTEGVMHLVNMVTMLCPDLIPPEMATRAMRLVLYHDAAEVESGDTPDDGNRNDQQKDVTEYATLQRFTRSWPDVQKFETRIDALDMQHKSSITGQVVYCMDKIEAVLRLLEYEQRGVTGDITAKPRMSAQDEENRLACGTNNPCDVWGRHAVIRIRGCMGFSLACEILRAAFEAVRGEVPKWLVEQYPEAADFTKE